MSICELNIFIPTIATTLLFTIRFVDRDMMMRFRGGGVGHKSTREVTDHFWLTVILWTFVLDRKT